MDERWRSTEDIRQDIAREEENFSRTAQQIGDRIKAKLDWTEYVKDSPYWALGISVGIGFFASRMLQTRSTPLERIMDSIGEEVRHSLGGLHVGTAGPNLAQVTLLGIGTKLAVQWIRNANSTGVSRGGVSPASQAEYESTTNRSATT